MNDTLVITLKRVTCFKCGMVFGMPEGLYDARHNDHETFWCVACGKSQHWPEKAAKTRYKNQIKAGRCPSCGKEFPDLAKHMKHEHPNFY